MFKLIKLFFHHYKLISATTAELYRLEYIMSNCQNKQIRFKTYKKLLGVRLFFSEITGKPWKSQKPTLRLDNFYLKKTTHKKT